MLRCVVRQFFTGLSISRHFFVSLCTRSCFKVLRRAKPQSGRHGSLFALVVVLMLFGTLLGWVGENIPGASILKNYQLPTNITFTPGPEHTGMYTKVHNTADQISTNFDPASGRLLISSSVPVHQQEQPLLPTVIATIDPGSFTSHVDTGSRLQIPALNIDASIETVGTQMNGSMDVPALHLTDGVGWYQKGPWPGRIGSAVIDGYVRRPDSSPAVFSRLGDLHAGDLILIVNPDGSEQHFHVAFLSSYPPNHVPLASIFSDTSGIYLNLVTCTGTWTSNTPQSTEPLIVHAVKN